jgi:predicted porin
MKKSLFVLSALAFAAAAHAQSSVTLAGTVDVAYSRGNGTIGDKTSMISGGNATSKLIFRGTEDLGGGMSANFWLETGFTADNGEGQNTFTNNQATGFSPAVAANTGRTGLTFNRRSDVYLAAPWGEIHAGRLWNVNYEPITGKYDPFAIAVGIGVNYNYSLMSSAGGAAGAAVGGNIRVSNAIRYDTPKFGGFGGQIIYYMGENISTAANDKDGNGSGIRLYYDNGPLSVIGAYTKTKYLVAGDAKLAVISAVYDFRVVKASLIVNRDKQGGFEDKGWLLGLWVPIGAHEIKAAYSRLEWNTVGNPEVNKLALGYTHNLSKRTALYAVVARQKNKNGFALALNGATTGVNTSSTGLDLGIRHNF